MGLVLGFGMLQIAFLLLVVGSLFMASEASIHHYRNRSFTIQLNARFFQGGSEGLYASSFIRFDDVTFVRTVESAMQSATGLVEAIIFEGKDRERIGGSFPVTHGAICCTPELAAVGSCNLGEFIITRDSNDPEWPKQIKTFFEGNKTEAKMSPEVVVINKTGLYYLYFIICDPELDGTLIRGTTVWKNPYGYLPGKVAPLMKFFGFMSLAYVLLGLVWYLRFAQLRNQLHRHITLVIALGMCEMAVRYYEYAYFDSTGMRPMGVTFWAVTFSTTRKTLSRLLLLLVSMGYGVVKPTLGCITARVLLLGVAYSVATVPLELNEHLGNINDLPGKTITSLVVPVALLDGCFILWIFTSLAHTLQIRMNVAKLKLYRNLTSALAIYVVLSIGWISFELNFYDSDTMCELLMAWIIPAVWNLLSYGLLAAICIIWRILADHGESGQSTTENDEIELSTIIVDGAR